MPDALKLDALDDPFGQGFFEEGSMSVTLFVKGVEVLVFMHKLDVYVMLPYDFEERGIVVRSERDILNELREEFGREIRSVKLYAPNIH